MIKILCICPNRQTIKNIVPVVNLLKLTKGVRVDFLNVDPFLHQDVMPLLNNENIINLGISINKPFFRLSTMGRLMVVLFKIPKFRFEHSYDILLIGGLSILEYFITKRLKIRNSSIKVFLIQDAILLYPEKHIFRKRIRTFIYGFRNYRNLCDVIFVSGEASKNTLIIDGVNREKIFVTGIPRFSELFNYSYNNVNIRRKINILFISGGFSWHGDQKLVKKQIAIIEKLNVFAANNINLEIGVKIHPRDYDLSDISHDFTNLRFYGRESIDNYKLILNYDIVACAFIPSTLIFEASWLSKMALVITDGGITKENQKYIKDIPFVSIDKFFELIYDIDAQGKKMCLNNIANYISEKSKYSDELIVKKIIGSSYD